MKYILIIILVAVLAGCAGGFGKTRTCIKDAVSHSQEKSEKLEKMHTEPKVTDSCEVITSKREGMEQELNEILERLHGEFVNSTYFRCDVADPIDDEDYAHLLNMYMRSLRMDIESCLP